MAKKKSSYLELKKLLARSKPFRLPRAPALPAAVSRNVDQAAWVRYKTGLEKLARLQEDKRFLDTSANVQNALFAASALLATAIPAGRAVKTTETAFGGLLELYTWKIPFASSPTFMKIVGIGGSVSGALSPYQIAKIKEEVDLNERVALSEFNKAADVLKAEVVDSVKSESSERFILGKIDAEIQEANKGSLTLGEKLDADIKELERIIKLLDGTDVHQNANVTALKEKKVLLEAQIANTKTQVSALAVKMQTLQSQRNIRSRQVEAYAMRTQQLFRSQPVYKYQHSQQFLLDTIHQTLAEDQKLWNDVIPLHHAIYGNAPFPVQYYTFLPENHPIRQKQIALMQKTYLDLVATSGVYEKSQHTLQVSVVRKGRSPAKAAPRSKARKASRVKS